jgi:pimeloyl-ACP methyl ester carboxylesterase
MSQRRAKTAAYSRASCAFAAGLLLGAIGVVGRRRYLRDKREALAAKRRGSAMLSTPLGDVEYAISGVGQPVLIMHGAGGGYDQGLLLHKLLDPAAFRGISISRPGYRRTLLNTGRTFAAQADLYAVVLDHFGVERAIILALSAGGLPALQFAQRYPERCQSLILLSAAGPVTVTLDAAGRVMPLFRALISADWALWILKKAHVLATLATMGAITRSVRADARRMSLLNGIFEAVFPSSDWDSGLVNDIRQMRDSGIVLEQITTPTLIIHGTRDLQVPFATAISHSHRIPHAELVALDDATHFAFATHYDEVVAAMSAFIRKVV